jgi:putative transposase
MARRLRDEVPGFSYHLTQRGNQKMWIFHDDVDRRVYLKLLVQQCGEQRVRIWAYSLMGNHVHHIAVPDKERALSRAFKRIFGEYARYYNTRYVKTGHVFQGRFKSTILDERHLANAVAYVERNPVRAGMVRRAEDYVWSSARAHCGLHDDPVLANDLPLIAVIPDWSAWLANDQRQEDLEFIRRATATGRPCASEEFARMLEAKLGKPCLRRKPGPKKKISTEQEHAALPFPEGSGFE